MKKLISAVTATTFVLGLTLTAHAAMGVECKILASKEDALIMDCGKLADTFDVGTTVTLQKENVKTKKKAALIEGC